MQNASFAKDRNFKTQMIKVYKSGSTFNVELWLDNFFTDCYTFFWGVSYMVKELYTSYKPALRICCNYENDKKIEMQADINTLDHDTGIYSSVCW